MSAERRPSFEPTPEEIGRNVETLLVPEVEYRHTKKIAVYGVNGKGDSGNSVYAGEVAELLGIPEDRVYYIGKIFRLATNSGDFAGFIERPTSVDKAINQTIRNLIKNADPEYPILIEAKLVGAISRDLELTARETGETIPSVFKILKSANLKKRARIAQSKPDNKDKSLRQLLQELKDRDEKDMIQWNEADEMIGRFSNILEKNATDTEGRPVYDLVIDSSKTTLEEDLERTLTFLLAEGIVKKITPDQNPEENSN